MVLPRSGAANAARADAHALKFHPDQGRTTMPVNDQIGSSSRSDNDMILITTVHARKHNTATSIVVVPTSSNTYFKLMNGAGKGWRSVVRRSQEFSARHVLANAPANRLSLFPTDITFICVRNQGKPLCKIVTPAITIEPNGPMPESCRRAAGIPSGIALWPCL
jgi:hypothetical protein